MKAINSLGLFGFSGISLVMSPNLSDARTVRPQGFLCRYAVVGAESTEWNGMRQ